MTRMLIKVVTGLCACAVLAGVAMAQDADEVTVSALRLTNTRVTVSPENGTLVKDITLSYGVSVAGLDLRTKAGAAELQRQVNDAAAAVCREVGRQFPDSTPNDQDCTRQASSRAMIKANALIAAAQHVAH